MWRIKTIEETIERYFNLVKPVLICKMKERFDKDRLKRKKEGKEGTLKDQVAQRRYEDWYVKHSDDSKFDNHVFYPFTRKMKLLVEL